MHTQSITLALRHFAYEHDDLPAFHAGYLVLTIVAAGMLNLGAFAVLIAAHFSLDLVKYREVHGFTWAHTFEASLREGLMDFFLFATALAFSTYLHHAIGIAALSGVIRSDLSFARLAGVFLPKFEILHRFVAVLLHIGEHMRTVHLRIGQALTAGEKLQIFLLVASILLILSAPGLLHIPAAAVGSALAHEMIPWRL